MKNLINLILILFVSVAIISCRGDEVPQDIHEHEEIEKVTLTITDKGNTANVQTINYIGGVADKSITLQKGKSYTVSLDFFHKHDDHYHSMLDEIIEEKNQHFITYEFAGVSANVIRIADDVSRNDGKKLGVKTEWSVVSAPSAAKVNIKLYHGPTSVDDKFPSADNQLGKAMGGDSDVNAYININ